MKSYRSPKTIIKDSRKGGKGLFAAENIPGNELIAIRSGHIVNKDEAMKLDREVGDFSLRIAEDFYLCPKTSEEIDDLVIYINHSCDPNTGMEGNVCYVAMRDIKAGEELCMDYAMAVHEEFKMTCNCGSENCRGIVTGRDWLSKDLQKRYGRYFSSFILKAIHSVL